MTLLILERNLKLREGVAGIRIFQMHPKEKIPAGGWIPLFGLQALSRKNDSN